MNPPTPQVKAAMAGQLGNHPDPEGDRLRDALISKLNLWGGRALADDADRALAWSGITPELKAYRDHRTKADTPKAELGPDRCRACDGNGWHPIAVAGVFAHQAPRQQCVECGGNGRTKAAPEVVPEPRCEPPEEFRHLRWHWIRGFSGGHHPAEWEDGAWRVTGETAWQSPGAFFGIRLGMAFRRLPSPTR